MSKQGDMWLHKFGDEYTERNMTTNLFRGMFWESMQDRYGFVRMGKILEVGCGDGKNLRYFNYPYGIDINRKALSEAKKVFSNSKVVEDFDSLTL